VVLKNLDRSRDGVWPGQRHDNGIVRGAARQRKIYLARTGEVIENTLQWSVGRGNRQGVHRRGVLACESIMNSDLDPNPE
jgi:hypothetical protein